MVNKKFWLGMLVLTLVFGMTVVGCDDEHIGPSKVELTNGTTFKIKSVVFYDDIYLHGKIVVSDPIGIESAQKKTYDLGSRDWNETYGYSVKITVALNLLSEVEVVFNSVYINGLQTDKLLLSGTNTDTLELSLTGTVDNY
jgi:hypothetical protein